MNTSKFSHQIWTSLPTTENITEVLPQSFSDELLLTYTNAADWLSAPNTFNWKDEAFISMASAWKSQLLHAPGGIRLVMEGNYSDAELRVLYAMVSRLLGYLNNRYSYFFDVQDRGLDYTKEAIPVSKTKAETGYHTDSTAKHYYPDIIGLLCLQPALSGGESLMTNAANLLIHLHEKFPELTNLLHTPLCRDVITPGTVQDLTAIRANDIPLFQYDDQGGVIFRYMRYWIESALEKLEEPAPAGLKDVLNAIDSFFAHPENAMSFRLNRGDMLFVNNRFICHNRTAFVDGDKPRVYVRTWINHGVQD
jgi:hypothetical protein